MQNTRKYFLAAFTAVAFLSSCAPDDDLEIDDRDKFIDTWTCNDNGSSSGTSTYSVTVERVGEQDSIRLKNFYNLLPTNSVIAKVSGNNLTIPQQVSDGYNINGSGSFSNNGFKITYTAVDNSVTDNGTAVYSK